jgi:folate-dependent phosphoribosylglycinamide formyltransferase PurN
MIPAELNAQIIDLPTTENYRIVIITGAELRHDRFALRLQSEFPELVAAWLQVMPESLSENLPSRAAHPQRISRLAVALFSLVEDMPRILASRSGRRAIIERIQKLHERAWKHLSHAFLPRGISQRVVEERLFADEIERLHKTAYVTPTVVQNPDSVDVIASIKALDPYFILTSGHTIRNITLSSCARGLALSQHEGWCPEYRGSNPVDWALYHRDLCKVSNTIHIVTDGGGSGPILRRSSACLAIDDTPESCLARSVALGTELMCETVRELIQTKRARIYRQPQFTGYTYVRQQMTDDTKRTIDADLQRGLIRIDLVRQTNF